jgi:hypothetical protein
MLDAGQLQGRMLHAGCRPKCWMPDVGQNAGCRMSAKMLDAGCRPKCWMPDVGQMPYAGFWAALDDGSRSELGAPSDPGGADEDDGDDEGDRHFERGRGGAAWI